MSYVAETGRALQENPGLEVIDQIPTLGQDPARVLVEREGAGVERSGEQ